MSLFTRKIGVNCRTNFWCGIPKLRFCGATAQSAPVGYTAIDFWDTKSGTFEYPKLENRIIYDTTVYARPVFAPSRTCPKIASERCTGIGLWTSETTLPEQTGLPKFGATQWGSHTISPQRFWKNGYLRGPSRPSAAQKGWLPTRPGAPRFLPQKSKAFLRTEWRFFHYFFSKKLA